MNGVEVFQFTGKADETKCDFSVALNNFIQIIAFSPYDWCPDLVCIAHPTNVIISTCKFSEKNVDLSTIHHFYTGVRVHCIAWSPETSLDTLPKVLTLCVGASDFKIRILKSDLLGVNSCNILQGHVDYINDIGYSLDNKWIASVSDDHTCRLWSTDDDNCNIILKLGSPGISLTWHTDERHQLVVGEKRGLIRLYNVDAQLALMSIDTNEMIFSVHSCPQNQQKIAACSGEKILIWDMMKSNRAIDAINVGKEKGGSINFNSTGELIGCLNTIDGSFKIIHVINKTTVISSSLKVPTSLSWHRTQSVICVADNKTLRFWRVPLK